MDTIKDQLSFYSSALQLRGRRNNILASNIANAATPNYKARDISFEDEIKKFDKLKGEKKTAAIANHKQMLSDKMVSDVNAVLERAKGGDQAAIDIINQANWYRSMRSRLRREFGGLSDVFADILGATSAMTNVQQNYENALGVLRSFVRGDFDKQIEMYKKIADEGGNLSSTQLTAMAKDANIDFDLIRNQHSEIMEKLLEGVSLTNTKELVFEKLNELEKRLSLRNCSSHEPRTGLEAFGEPMRNCRSKP